METMGAGNCEDGVFITGASGLLGRQLTRVFQTAGLHVYAQYRRLIPAELKALENCLWLNADFSEPGGLHRFLEENLCHIRSCRKLINNYGPITSKPIAGLQASDIQFDFYHNVVVAWEMTRFFIENAPLQTVVNIGYQGMDEPRAYRKIAAYAGAKAALKILTRSMAAEWSGIQFHFFEPPTMIGADVRAPGAVEQAPDRVAEQIARLVL